MLPACFNNYNLLMKVYSCYSVVFPDQFPNISLENLITQKMKWKNERFTCLDQKNTSACNVFSKQYIIWEILSEKNEFLSRNNY